jgi:hypothetical protein
MIFISLRYFSFFLDPQRVHDQRNYMHATLSRFYVIAGYMITGK